MKTAGINAGRKNAPEGPQLNDEPSPEVGPQAEASHVGTDTGTPADREGRHEGEAASVDLPTIPRNIVAEVRELWNLATPSERDEIRAIINSEVGIPTTKVSMQEPHVEAEGQGRVREHGRGEGSQPRLPSDPVENKTDGPSVIAAAPHSPSTAPTVEPEATPSPPPASGTHSNPQPVSLTTADKAEASTSSPSASAAPFAVMSKADQIRLIRPHCQHLDDLEKCGGSGRNHCPACKKLAAESEAA
jgi:hypothetical protein